MTIFLFFQDGGRPPSWTSYVGDWTTREGHLVVFITVQNFVRIDVVILIICMFFDFASLARKRLCTPPKLGFRGTFPPNNNPRQDRPWAESRHLSHKTCISAARFELGVGVRKKDRTGKKSHKWVIFHVFGVKPPVNQCTSKIL